MRSSRRMAGRGAGNSTPSRRTAACRSWSSSPLPPCRRTRRCRSSWSRWLAVWAKPPLPQRLKAVSGGHRAGRLAWSRQRSRQRRQASRRPARRWASARPARPSHKLMEPAAKPWLPLRRDVAGRRPSQPALSTHPSSPRPGRRADGEIRGSPRRAAGRRRTHTREVRRTCGPLAVDARQEPLLGASRVGQNLHELNDEFAIFKAWPSEQNRVAATHLLPVPELKWAKEEGGLFYLARSEYDLACRQV
mmetsp:Transcript_44849/g.145727  ORF Transcript_44849/g.145727 Transcript_44849/m.145727 type:complete len:248 (-) Transcript_44849:199-942(-)